MTAFSRRRRLLDAAHEQSLACSEAPALTLASVEAFITERRRKMRFPSWLEAEFERDNWDRRSKIIRLVAFRTAVVYNVFLITIGSLFATASESPWRCISLS